MIGWKWPAFFQSAGDTILTIYSRPQSTPCQTMRLRERSRWFTEHTPHHITYTTYPSLYFHIQPLTHNSVPATDQNKQRFLFPIIPMVGDGPEATPGVKSNCRKYLDKKQIDIVVSVIDKTVCVSVPDIYNFKAQSIGVRKYRDPDTFLNVILKISTSWTWIVLHSWAFLYILLLPPYAILYTQEVWVLTLRAPFKIFPD